MVKDNEVNEEISLEEVLGQDTPALFGGYTTSVDEDEPEGDFLETVADDTITFDEDEGKIVLHGPRKCLVLACTEDYSLKELRDYFDLLRENLVYALGIVEEVVEESNN